jgi:hypothetical protein
MFMAKNQTCIPHSPDLSADPVADLRLNLINNKSPVSMLAHELDSSLFVNTEYYALLT